MIVVFVLSVVLLVAVFDVSVGIRLLTSKRPYEVNGPGTLWSRGGPAAFEQDERLAGSVFQRLGAFSLHTGVATTVWALSCLDRPSSLLALLGTYTLTGLAFFRGDRAYFAGTRYFTLKQVLGGLWSAALVAQIVVVAG